MAEENDQKTEDPTQKRLDEAHEKGQVAVSRELNHWFMFGGGLIAVFVFRPQLVRDVSRAAAILIERPHAITVDVAGLTNLFTDLTLQIATAMAPMLAVPVVAAAGGPILHAGTR